MVQLSLFLSHHGGAPCIRSPRTPTLRSEGGTRESGAAAARRIPRRCAQAELQLARARGPAAAPGSLSSAQHLVRSRRGRRRCKLGPRALGAGALRSGEPRPDPRARKGSSAQKPLRRRREARQGGLRGPQNKELQAGRTCGFGCQVPNPQTRAGGAAGGSGYRGWPDCSHCAAAAGMVWRGPETGRAGAEGSGGRADDCAGAGGAARSAPSRRCSPRISFRDPVI